MDPKDALQMIDNILAKAGGSREDHFNMQQMIGSLQGALARLTELELARAQKTAPKKQG